MADNELKVRFTGDTKGLDKATRKAEKDLKGFNKTAVNLGKSLAGVFAVGAIVNFTKESIKLAATIEGVERRFKQLNGVNLNDLQRATRGTVDNLSLMKAAVQAKNFKIPLENLGKFFQFATQRAVETGESVDHLVNSIIIGVGRKSPLILDNLGISAVELRKKLKGVGLESASVADISDAMNSIIDESAAEFGGLGKEALTTSQQLAQVNVDVQNLKQGLGELAIDAGAVDLLQGLTKQAKEYVSVLSGIVKGTKGGSLDAFIEEQKKLNEETQKRALIQKQVNTILKEGEGRELKLLEAYKQNVNFEAIRSGVLDALKPKVKEVISLTEEQQKVLDKLDFALKKVSASVGIQGTDFTRTEERIGIYQEGLINLIALGLDPASEKAKELNKQLRIQQSLLKEAPDALTGEGLGQPNVTPSSFPEFEGGGAQVEGIITTMTEAQVKAMEFRRLMEGVGESVGLTFENIGTQLADMFNGMIQEGNLTFKSLIIGLGRLIAKLLIATGIAAAFRAILGDPTAPARGAQAIGAVASSIGGLVGAIPQLAEGGVTNGPTLAMIGEGKEQEAVLPLSKLAGLMSGGFGINSRQSSVSTNSSAMSRVSSNNSSNSSAFMGNVKFRLEGNDLVGSIQRTFKNNGSSGGAVSFG